MNLRREILKTLALYRAQGKVSLTARDLFFNLNVSKTKSRLFGLKEIKYQLRHDAGLRKYLICQDNYFGLRLDGRDDDLAARPDPAAINLKINLLRKFLPFLMAVPYTRLIFLAGSTALGTATLKSDIDLVIIGRHDRLWLNRTLLQAVAGLGGRRRGRREFQNKFCFNFSLSPKNLKLPHEDAVSANFYKHLVPVWTNEAGLIKQFWRANSWLKNYSPFFIFPQRALATERFVWPGLVQKFLEFFLEKTFLAPVLEKSSAALQKLYLRHALAKSPPQKHRHGELHLSRNFISYHFPVSNHYQVSQKYSQMTYILKTVEKM